MCAVYQLTESLFSFSHGIRLVVVKSLWHHDWSGLFQCGQSRSSLQKKSRELRNAEGVSDVQMLLRVRPGQGRGLMYHEAEVPTGI